MNLKKIKRRLLRISLYLISLLVVILILGIIADFIWPFDQQKLKIFAPSPIVYDTKGRNMLSLVSPEQQWCMPIELEDISPHLIDATIAIEDNRFYRHLGVDTFAVIRATKQNIANHQVISGASTLTMQICRMIDNRPRTLKNKMIEAFRACQLERIRSKEEILEIYLNYAPYGGNLRGVEAASLFYFSKHANELSIAQSAFLAGLPQSPTRFNPFSHMDDALKRQQAVLNRMLETGKISQLQYSKSIGEEITITPINREINASHVAWLALNRKNEGGRLTIDLDIQKQIETACDSHLKRLPVGSEIAVVVIDIENSSIVAMLGSGDSSDPIDGQVNGAISKRSPGSTLKTIIYASAFEAKRLSPDSIVYDYPISLSGWKPQNFDRIYEGQVSACDALRKSLNIPALWIANCLGPTYCYNQLESVGINLPNDVEMQSGLSFIVGGCETSLLELTNAYAVFGREGIYKQCRLFMDDVSTSKQVFSPEVCANINHILSNRIRVPHGMESIEADNLPWFMWKTGTSSGRRDAWAIGHNNRYAIGVWVGRFRGSGRYEYVGSQAAEPLLAQLFVQPELKSYIEPPITTPLIVQNPLPVPDRIDNQLHIISPENGETFIAYNEAVKVYPKANQTETLYWFLNGIMQTDIRQPLELSPGHYNLRCVNQQGNSSVVVFSIQRN